MTKITVTTENEEFAKHLLKMLEGLEFVDVESESSTTETDDHELLAAMLKSRENPDNLTEEEEEAFLQELESRK